MPDVTALFWDVGGVILSNGWDRPDRAKAVKKFGLDWEEFEDRHELASPAYETGEITLDTYLQRTVFYRKRDFTQEEFTHSFSRSRKSSPNHARFFPRWREPGNICSPPSITKGLELNEHRIRAIQLEAGI